MKILIIGGTQFVGRALVHAALAKGYEISLFHRGKTNADLFPNVEHIFGDRFQDLAALGNRQWDVVIDTCAYVPRAVKLAGEYLADKTKSYVFISTISVYADSEVMGRDETAPLVHLEDTTSEEVTGGRYGGLKVLCEETVETFFPDRNLIIRPGLIVGPHDPSNRFTYWTYRIRRGGQVLAPSNPDYAIQVIDVRDLAEWTIQLIEAQATGIYHATGPDYPLTLGKVLAACQAVSQADAELLWVSEEFLQAQNVAAWSDLPLYAPDANSQALMHLNINKALHSGLKFRSLEETIQDTLTWVDSLNGNLVGLNRAGLSAEREAELLAAYQN